MSSIVVAALQNAGATPQYPSPLPHAENSEDKSEVKKEVVVEDPPVIPKQEPIVPKEEPEEQAQEDNESEGSFDDLPSDEENVSVKDEVVLE